MLGLLMTITPRRTLGGTFWGCGLVRPRVRGVGNCRFGIRIVREGGGCRLTGRMGLWFLMRSDVMYREGREGACGARGRKGGGVCAWFGWGLKGQLVFIFVFLFLVLFFFTLLFMSHRKRKCGWVGGWEGGGLKNRKSTYFPMKSSSFLKFGGKEYQVSLCMAWDFFDFFFLFPSRQGGERCWKRKKKRKCSLKKRVVSSIDLSSRMNLDESITVPTLSKWLSY